MSNTYIFNFGRSDNMGYDFAGSVIQGNYLNITIKNMPVGNWQWEMRQDVSYVNGVKNWQSGTLIQANTGVQATLGDLVIQAPIPLNASQFNINNLFSFNLVTNPGANQITGIEVYFQISSVSSNPTSSGLLGQGVYNWSGPNSFKAMTSGDLALINNGAGFDLTTLTNGGSYNSQAINLAKVFINGQEITSDQYSFFSNTKFKFLSPTVVYAGDVVDFYYPLSTFAQSGSTSGYGTFQVNGTSLANRATVNFVVTGGSGADNPGQNRTDITLPTAPVQSVAGRTGAVTLTKSDVGLDQVDNTSDVNKPISTATQMALNLKANTSSLAAVATSGSYTDLINKPTIPTAVSQLTNDLNFINQSGVRTSVSLTTTGTSGSATYNSTTGVFNIPVIPDVSSFATSATVATKQAKTSITIGFTGSGADYTSDNTTKFDTVLASAVSYLTSNGGGDIIFQNSTNSPYQFNSTVVLPKLSGIRIRSEKKLRGRGVSLKYTGTATTNFFDFEGDASVTSPSNLGSDVIFEEITIDGNNLITNAVYSKNTESPIFRNCRIINVTNVRSHDFAGTTPVPGANKPGGVRSYGGNYGGQIIMQNQTQMFEEGSWFEGTAPTTWATFNSVDKLVWTGMEFNTVQSGGAAITLNDSATDPTNSIILNGMKFDVGSGQNPIKDNRTNSSSKGVFVSGAMTTGTFNRVMTNPQTNLIALAGGYNSNSYLAAGEVAVDGLISTDRPLSFQESGVVKFQLYLASSGNLGIRRASSGSADFYWDKNDGGTNAKTISVFGTAGNGFSFYPAQSSNPTAPSASGIRLYSESNGDFGYTKFSDGKRRLFAGVFTADRTKTWQDTTGTIAELQNTLDQFAVPVASLNLNSQKIINLLDPTLAQDAATKNYVDTGLATKQASLGYTPLNPVNNLSDVTNASTARTNLGLAIGVNVQAYNANTTTQGNKVTLTQPATGSTLTILDGKTLTSNNTLTLSGTDGSTLNIGAGGTLGSAAYTASSAYEVPLTFSTGLTRTVNTITVNTSQNISTLSNLTSNGFVKTSGGTGALSVDTTSYLPLGGGTLTGKLTTLASASGGAGFNIPSGAAPTSPTDGDLWYDSTDKGFKLNADGLSQNVMTKIFAQTANSTAVANTTTTTTIVGTGIGNQTLPANYLVSGKTVIMEGGGVFSTTGTPTLTIALFLGATQLIAFAVTTPSGASTLPINYSATITSRGAGASTNVRSKLTLIVGAAGGAASTIYSNFGSTTIDTTGSLIVDIKATWGTASASNTITGTTYILTSG